MKTIANEALLAAPRTRPPNPLRSVVRQTKFFLCLMISLSGIFGYLLSTPAQNSSFITSWLGILLLTLGAASLNNIQDRDIDGRLQRTAQRPLITGDLSFTRAVILTLTLIGSGIGLLLIAPEGGGNALLGGLSLLLYNGFYTPWKRRTTLALIPGAICGAMPVLIGFHAATGSIFNPLAVLAFVTLVLWQFPHFFILLLLHKDDYQHRAPGLLVSHLDLFNEHAMKRMIFGWGGALSSVLMLYVAIGLVKNGVLALLVLLSAIGLTLLMLRYLWWQPQSTTAARKLFIGFNQVFALFMVLIVMDRLI